MVIKFLGVPKEKSEFVCRIKTKHHLDEYTTNVVILNTKDIKSRIANKNMLRLQTADLGRYQSPMK